MCGSILRPDRYVPFITPLPLTLIFLLPVFLFPSGCREVPEESSGIRYLCESGNRIVATYTDSSTAVIEFNGQRVRLKIAISASGARYTGGGLVWWTKGTGPDATATLYRHEPGDRMGEVLEQCREEAGQ